MWSIFFLSQDCLYQINWKGIISINFAKKIKNCDMNFIWHSRSSFTIKNNFSTILLKIVNYHRNLLLKFMQRYFHKTSCSISHSIMASSSVFIRMSIAWDVDEEIFSNRFTHKFVMKHPDLIFFESKINWIECFNLFDDLLDYFNGIFRAQLFNWYPIKLKAYTKSL